MKKRALVCDDDQHIRDLVQAILELDGYSVITAENGRKACDIIENPAIRSHLNLMVLDVRMPEMTGLDVLDSLRENGRMQAFPIIMLTAEGTTQDIVLGYEKGASYYITKPFTKQQLMYGVNLVSGDDKE
jgi:DNA-binding response OmpR family regulator